jgi:DNA-binding transcriptional MocR family regulator
MDSMLKVHLSNVTYTVPEGGYFFWVRLPESMNAVEVRKQAKLWNVDVRPGTLFSCENGLYNFVRLCFAYYDEAQIEEGILRLRKCFESM